MESQLSIDEQQWLLIIRDRKPTEIPHEVRASLAAKGLTNEDGDLALTDLGIDEADAIAAANFKLSLTPPPS